jgi:site-specific recombinase XerD
MGGLGDNKLYSLLHDYFITYLPNVKRYSPHTIRSYQKAMELLLDYVKDLKRVKLYDITFDMIDRAAFLGFLRYLEDERKSSISTRNHRLQCIRSFYRYAAQTDITVAAYWDMLRKIDFARTEEPVVGYMSEAAVEAVLAQPDLKKKKGRRDMFLMLLLYQTGARVQEILDIRLVDIHMGKTPTITLRGKGKKVRTVPLREKAVGHLKGYLTLFHPDAEAYSEDYLFYIRRDGVKKRMTEDNVRKLIRDYGNKARAQYSEVPPNVHPHLFRHSRAMHLYQNGVNLILVSQWLGHSRLETTLIYAYADTEQKRRAIEKAIPEESTLKKHLNANRFQIGDDETLKQLCGLR